MHSSGFPLFTSAAILSCWLSAAVPAMAISFATDTLIDAGSNGYDGIDIVVDGCVLTVNGSHTLASLSVVSAGIVTHSATAARFDLTITGDLTVDAVGSIELARFSVMRCSEMVPGSQRYRDVACGHRTGGCRHLIGNMRTVTGGMRVPRCVAIEY